MVDRIIKLSKDNVNIINKYKGRFSINVVNYKTKDLYIELNKYDVKYMLTFNQAGNVYGWGQFYSEIEIIIDNSIVNMYKLRECLLNNWGVDLDIQNVKRQEYYRIDNMNITLWLWLGFRTYTNIPYIEKEYDGIKIKVQEKESLIDCIKYNLLHRELRAFLALEEDLKVDKNCQFWYIRTL